MLHTALLKPVIKIMDAKPSAIKLYFICPRSKEWKKISDMLFATGQGWIVVEFYCMPCLYEVAIPAIHTILQDPDHELTPKKLQLMRKAASDLFADRKVGW